MSNTIDLGPLEDFPVRSSRVVPFKEAGTTGDVAVFRAEDGEVYALDDECTHGMASLAEGFIEGDVVECPLHSSGFCLRNGRVMNMPATEDAPTHRIEIADGRILLHAGTPAEDRGDCAG